MYACILHICTTIKENSTDMLNWSLGLLCTFQVNGGIQCMAIRHFGELLVDMSQYKWMLNHIVLGSLVPMILFLESTEARIANVRAFFFFLKILYIILFLPIKPRTVLYVTANQISLIFSLFQACRYTLSICVSQLKWSTLYLLQEENYNFESVVLSICNNIVSRPLL